MFARKVYLLQKSLRSNIREVLFRKEYLKGRRKKIITSIILAQKQA